MSVRCMLCGGEFGQVTGSHLQSAHGITVDEYRERFPGVVLALLSEETKRMISESLLGKAMSGETKGLLREANLGKTHEELIAHYKQYGIDCLVIWEYDIWDEEDIVRRVRALK